jgi:ubiquinone/menaquinone biosynthesis C-methylase UbiE
VILRTRKRVTRLRWKPAAPPERSPEEAPSPEVAAAPPEPSQSVNASASDVGAAPPDSSQSVDRTSAPALGRLADRSDYKGTWTALSTNPSDAAMWVAGTTDEEHLAVSGAYTVEQLRRMVGINPTDDFLEIGCGIGRVGRALAPLCAHWTGADISPNMVEVARQRLQDLENVNLVELATVGLAEFEGNSFDAVYCTVVFMHLFEWDRFRYVQEAFRVLRPGGRCYFDNVDIRSAHGRKFFASGTVYELEQRPPHIGMVSTGDELQSYGEWAGFENVRIHRWDDAWVALTGTKPTPR